MSVTRSTSNMGINGDAYGARGDVSGGRGTKGNVEGNCCVTHT